MRKYITILIATLCAVLSLFPRSYAGNGWVSGGGEVFDDRFNPWFLNHVRSVNFCLEIDEENFGVSRAVATQMIMKAWHFWRVQFNEARSAHEGDLDIVVATQILNDMSQDVQSCEDPKVDIKFQFGVLNQKQKEYLRDPSKVVGVAVRTDYDEVQLKGKGFVYISPESGPLALKQEDGHGRIYPNRWSSGNHGMLLIVLAHELGHVFGLQHHSEDDLMGVEAPRRIISAFAGDIVSNAEKIVNFFLPGEDNSRSFSTKWIPDARFDRESYRVFSLANNASSLRIVPQRANNQTYALFDTTNMQDRRVGLMTMQYGLKHEEKHSVNVFLTAKQRVFKTTIPQSGLNVRVDFVKSRIQSAIYEPDCDGCKSQPVMFQESPYELEVSGLRKEGYISTLLYFDVDNAIRFVQPRSGGK